MELIAPDPLRVETYLNGQIFPCSREDLMRTARGNGAGPEILSIMEYLPHERYASPEEVSQAVERLRMA